MELTGSRPVSWIGTTQPTSCSGSISSPASAFPLVPGMGAHNGPERRPPQNQGHVPACEKVALPLLKDSQEPCQF